MVQKVHETDLCVQQEVGQSEGGTRTAFRFYELLPYASNAGHDARYGCGDRGSSVGTFRAPDVELKMGTAGFRSYPVALFLSYSFLSGE